MLVYIIKKDAVCTTQNTDSSIMKTNQPATVIPF